MAFESRRVSFTTTGTTGSALLIPRTDVVEVIGFRCVSTGDTGTRVTLTDADGRVAFTNAGDINYTTLKDTVIGLDATGSGSGGWTLVDSTGAAGTIALGNGLPARGPITVGWSNGTSGDAITFDLMYKFPLTKKSITLVSPAATVSGTLQLPSRFAQVIGFSALLTGADSATRIQIADADGRIVYLDAADVDYTARKNFSIGLDDTLTGLTPQHLDGTGVAATATSAAPLPVVKSPLTVSLVNDA